MSGYLPTIRFDTEYEGDKPSIEMNSLTRTAFIKMLPALNEAKKDGEKMAVYEVACEILDEHIVSLTGLRDKNGNAVEKDAFLNSVYFIDLAIATFNELIEKCSLGKLKSTDLEVKSPESTEAPTSKTSH